MTTTGNFGKILINGIDATGDGYRANPVHAFAKNKVMPYGVGIAQSAVGIFDPKLGIDAYINSTLNSNTIFNLLQQTLGGSSAPVDIQYLIAVALGQNAVPVVGDAAWMGGWTIGSIKPSVDVKGILTLNGTFAPRGLQTPLGRVICTFSGADNAVPSTFFDHGTNAIGLAKGGGFMTHVITPTGTAASGNTGFTGQPVAADTFTCNGVVFTWVSSIGAAAGNVLIGASALASAQNLFDALTASPNGKNVTYVPVTAANQATLNAATYSTPAGANSTITVTYRTTGTGGNAFTLVRSGTGGQTVSGATLTGGLAGDALTITLQSATTSGGSYTTRATSSLNGTTVGADYQVIAVGTTIDEFVKVVVTGGAGQTVGLFCVYGKYFSQ